ncbi:unnamed protein product [Triticum turgidum subsp. durum]|uniref:MHD1 domain-containing protein n=1 Tax=Triticum turgidum subsp. durum TaxID=4567 RepID=A0A9R0TDV5_TRITD|nr:unnamed protein product [Triticum turgidum subsp. durum]
MARQPAKNNQTWKRARSGGFGGRLLPARVALPPLHHFWVAPASASARDTTRSAGTSMPMGPRLLLHYRSRSASYARSPDADALHGSPGTAADALDCPFGRLDGLSRADVREAAYEVFFMSCRAGGGGNAKGAACDGAEGGDASPRIGAGPRGGTGMNVVNSRVKRALGLKARRATQPSTALRSGSLNASSAPGSPGRAVRAPAGSPRARRPMTSAEIMRQQMRVTEPGDARLRKTLMRTLVGQVGRRAETIILPLELLRQLKLPDFADGAEHHQWQRRQLKLLEAGLITHTSVPLDHRHSASVLRFREVMEAAEARAIDTGKASDAMRALCDAVLALAWRSAPAGEACHWADGYPLNVILYVSLLQGIFDLRDETVVLDEVDELLELMRRTWATLGINRMLHNVCFAWVLFQQYVATGQVEPDLAGAALAVLAEVAADAGARQDSPRDPVYARVLSTALGAIRDWSEKRLLDYHEWYGNGGTGTGSTAALECALSLALGAGKIIAESVHAGHECGGDRVDYYIRCSMRSAFAKVLESGLGQEVSGHQRDVDDTSGILTQLARDTEELAQWEREGFSPELRRWHPFPAAVAAVTLHGCYGVVLKQYLGKAVCLTDELVRVLHAAGRLEKALVQMVADDDGEPVVREVVPYDVESVVVGFLRTWVEERLRVARECLLRAKDTESWTARSKNEPYAQSAVDLMKLAKATLDEFFAIPVSARGGMLQDLADGLGAVFQDYVSFLASCGNKQSYLPPLPALTRCNQDSTIKRLWKRAAVAPCRVPLTSGGRGNAPYHGGGQSVSAAGGHNPRPSTSRGTQRLYVRLNTIHYILSHIQALDKSLSFFSAGGGGCTSPSTTTSRLLAAPCCHFDHARTAAQTAIAHVAEVAAYRLIFYDSHHSFYDGLYAGGVADARIRPALRTLKQNLSLLVSILVDRAQPVAVREVMKASFQAFLMVLLAGGNQRSFTREDHGMVEEDLRSLKRAFCTRGEGLVAEEVVESEAEAAEGVVALMGQTAERVVEELSIATTAATAACGGSPRAALPMPLTTRRWCRTDPDTILRVLCHRDDEAASQFLKRAFQLPKRR